MKRNGKKADQRRKVVAEESLLATPLLGVFVYLYRKNRVVLNDVART